MSGTVSTVAVIPANGDGARAPAVENDLRHCQIVAAADRENIYRETSRAIVTRVAISGNRRTLPTEGIGVSTENGPPQQRRRRTLLDPCCSCTRSSTCSSLGRSDRHGCACRIAGRKCRSCSCFDTQCRNKPILMTTLRENPFLPHKFDQDTKNHRPPLPTQHNQHPPSTTQA